MPQGDRAPEAAPVLTVFILRYCFRDALHMDGHGDVDQHAWASSQLQDWAAYVSRSKSRPGKSKMRAIEFSSLSSALYRCHAA